MNYDFWMWKLVRANKYVLCDELAVHEAVLTGTLSYDFIHLSFHMIGIHAQQRWQLQNVEPT